MRAALPQTAAPGAGAAIRDDVCLIGVERSGVSNLPDLTARALLALARVDAEVLMITQSSAAGNFCLLIPRARLYAALDALRAELSDELERREILSLWARADVTLLRAGATGDVCGALGAHGINILLMQGADGGASLVIDAADAERAILALNPAAHSCYNKAVHQAVAHASRDGDEAQTQPDRSTRYLRRLPTASRHADTRLGADSC